MLTHAHIHAVFVRTPAIDSKNLESYVRHAERRTTTRRTGSACQLQKQNIEEGRSTTTAVRFLTRSRLTRNIRKFHPIDTYRRECNVFVKKVREVQRRPVSPSPSSSLCLATERKSARVGSDATVKRCSFVANDSSSSSGRLIEKLRVLHEC